MAFPLPAVVEVSMTVTWEETQTHGRCLVPSRHLPSPDLGTSTRVRREAALKCCWTDLTSHLAGVRGLESAQDAHEERRKDSRDAGL